MLTWVDISSLEQYKVLPATAKTLDIGDDAVFPIVLGFDYNWFGETFTEVCLSSNGQINMGEACDSSSMSTEIIGTYDGKRIAFVRQNLVPQLSGAVKYVVKKSPASLQVSFEDVKFHDLNEVGGIGNVQAQVELFANGDIIFCYGGDGSTGSPFNYFAAGVEDNSCHVAYPIPETPFNEVGITNEWPANRCWKFHMPAECTSMTPSVSSKPSHIPTVSFNAITNHLIQATISI